MEISTRTSNDTHIVAIAGSMDSTTSPEAQMEAIRRRIEARRAQLRAEARQKQQKQPDETP